MAVLSDFAAMSSVYPGCAGLMLYTFHKEKIKLFVA